MKRRLVQLFGPVVVAIVIVSSLLLLPLPQSQASQQTIKEAAVSLSPNVLLGRRLKNQALAEGYVPFMGSSELSRLDAFHPTVLATKYDRSYRPLLLGAPGTQSLTHFLDDQSWIRQYRGRKVVMILSLQWFTQEGQRADAFNYYYSPLQAITFLRHAQPEKTADRYAARRLLQMLPKEGHGAIRQGLLEVAAGQYPDQGLWTRLNLQAMALGNEDALFSRVALPTTQWGKVKQGLAQLPAKATEQQLDSLAARIGAQQTTNNDFGIDNHFFAKRLGGDKLQGLKNSQAHFDYRQSPEYGDLQLLLAQFARYHVQVQFVIPPINQKWATYTGLSQPMVAQATTKIKHQLTSQGFTHVLDLTQAGAKPYFMQDTIHLGWRGWVAVDRVVKPFLTQPQGPTHYRLNNHYFTKRWANAR
ncbi:MAG: D-alanyl-lipoteichoic acid biosynthesis protein DltD [Lactobacillus sp.]|jgi:D-alanine transfer protein|nr:D-alanyl-lipoteichoic acid biosynthesis protein DltD [Lactobacillus sp.]